MFFLTAGLDETASPLVCCNCQVELLQGGLMLYIVLLYSQQLDIYLLFCNNSYIAKTENKYFSENNPFFIKEENNKR